MDLSPQHIEQRVRSLGKWFHNLDLQGVSTAPDHFLGDYPRSRFQRFADDLPANLTGKSVLDVGCNAGFYSIEMKRRGARRVVAIDSDDVHLGQARFAAEISNYPDIEFRKMSVYDVARLGEKFDIVICMDVLRQLRHPLLALDILYDSVVADVLVFQSVYSGVNAGARLNDEHPSGGRTALDHDRYPLMYFARKNYQNDATSWWVPNRACVAAMLESAGFRIEAQPDDEIFICRRGEKPELGVA